jgi:hypothetical protein
MQVIKVTRVRCSRFIIKHPDLDPLGVYLHCIIYSKQLARHQSSRFVSSFPSLETRSLRAVRYDTLLSLNSAKEVRIDVLLGRRFVAGISSRYLKRLLYTTISAQPIPSQVVQTRYSSPILLERRGIDRCGAEFSSVQP